MTSENAIVKAAAGIADPAIRARHCQEFLVNGRATIREMERLRDDAIREARAIKHPEAKTMNRLAEFVKVKRNIVVDALRIQRAEGGGRGR